MKDELELKDFAVPALLVALSLVPAAGGVARLLSVARDTVASAENARFLASPAPVVIHVVSATFYALVGAFQFSAPIRRRWPRLHRGLGRLLVLAGLLVGVSGLWMTTLYRIPTDLQGSVLYGVRLAVAMAMIASLVAAMASIFGGRLAAHEAFMIRAYALAQGAGTQVFVLLPWTLVTGNGGGLTRDLLMTLSWAINIAVAELLIARKSRRAGVMRVSG